MSQRQKPTLIARNSHLHRELYIMRDCVHHNVALEIKSLVGHEKRERERDEETLLGNDKSDGPARTCLSVNERN